MNGRGTALLAILLALGACSGDSASERDVDVRTLASLQRLEGCESALDRITAQAIEGMRKELRENLEIALEDGYCDSRVFAGRGEGDYDAGANIDGDADADGDVGLPEASEEASEYSETNNQEVGVDEADFVKNDGGYIYILADGEFQIVDAWPAPESRVIASVEVEGTPKKLFVHEDVAVIYSSLRWSGDLYSPYYSSSECTYGYDCDFTGDGSPTKITVLDISDREAPVLVREMEFSGSYINSRRIGTAVYTVVNFPEIEFPRLQYWPERLEDLCVDDGFLSDFAIRRAFAQLETRNRAIIEATPITNWLPSVKDTIHGADGPVVQENVLGACDNFYASDLTDGHSLLTIASFDMTAVDDLHSTTVIGRPGAVYASRDALYVASRHRSEGDWWHEDGLTEVTTVHKFGLAHETPEAVYGGTGIVKGRVLNQFSMDEHDGYLRIATTTGHLPSPDVHSTISVLEDQQGGLEVVGVVDDIAPSEDIRSVRFDGERGFVVTFKKTDPLFAIDFSDPYAPAITGELKIPGFSTYMHFIDDDHLLAIGYDADDQGSFAWFQGILLQVFDVSDMEHPALMYREVIGTRGSTSDAATNHLAFNFFRSRDLLALPMVICEDGGGGAYGDRMTFSGLLVYRVTVDAGFELLGGVDHLDPTLPDAGDRVSCGNWWTQSNSQVKRSIFMEDFVYSIAPDLIKVANIDALGEEVANVELEDEAD